MQLRRLELSNFRNYERLTLDFTAPRSILIGENGKGKSTILDAIEWALRGRCRGVNGRGQGQKDLIRWGADTASVTLTFDHAGRTHQVIRQVSQTGPATGNMDPDTILQLLGVTDGMLATLLDGHTFFAFEHADGKNLLMRLLDVRIPATALPNCGLDPAETLTLDDIDQLHAKAYAERPLLKKALAALQVPDLPPAPEQADSLAVLQAGDQTVQADLREANRTLFTLTERHQGLARQIAVIDTKLQNKDQLQGKITAHQDMLAVATAALTAATDAQAAYQRPGGAGRETETRIGELRALVIRLQRHDPDRGCVLGAEIPCLTAAARFADRIGVIQAEVTDLETKLADVRAGLQQEADLAAAVKKAEQDRAYHQNQLERLTDQLNQQDTLQAERDAFDADATGLQRQVLSAKAAVDAVTDRADRSRAALQVARDYAAAVAAHQRAVAQQAAAKAALDLVENQVKEYGPKGIRLQALQQAVGDFEAMINTALRPFHFELHFQVDPWQVMVVQTADKLSDARGAVPYAMLSKGEGLWTGLAFQLALAVATGVGCCCVDDAEAVVGQARRVLTQVVMQAPVDQVIVAMAKGAGEVTPDISGLQVVRVEDLTAVLA